MDIAWWLVGYDTVSQMSAKFPFEHLRCTFGWAGEEPGEATGCETSLVPGC